MSEMVGSSIVIKVPLAWEGEVIVRHHISGWTEGPAMRPIYEGEAYVERTVCIPAFEWIDSFDVRQDEGEEFLRLSWDGELNYGWTGDSDAEVLLGWLTDHHIPFAAQCDAKYEMDGYELTYDGVGDYYTERPAGNGGAVIGWHEFQSICDKHHPGSARYQEDALRDILDDLHEVLRPFDLASCDISHLPPCPPPLEEEDEDAD